MPVKNIIRISAVLFLLFAISPVYTQPLSEQIDSLLQYMHTNYRFDGVVLASNGGNVVYQKAFGFADRKINIPNTTEKKFRLGSVSKQFTGFIILKLAEENRLSFSDPISKYLPGFNDTVFQKVHIKDLLTHTSGLADYTQLKDFDDSVLYKYDTIIKLIASSPLYFAPSSSYGYSNSNFFLLAQIAVRLTGKSFDTLLEEYITGPAGMQSTGECHISKVPTDMAKPYVFENNTFIDAPFIEMENTLGGGGLYSTAGDLLKWSLFIQKELKEDKFISNAISLNTLADSSVSIYAAGWCLLNGEIFHLGYINGFANQISIKPDNQKTVIILTNNNFKQLHVTSKTMQNILNGDITANDWIRNQPVTKDLEKYNGTYINNTDTVILKAENNKLITYFGPYSFSWRKGPGEIFFCENIEATFECERDADLNVTAAILLDGYKLNKSIKIK